jgi:tRNA nucleotidyltransferase (CCA-adding enzyme)
MLQSAERCNVNGHSLSFSRIDISGHVESLALVVRMHREIMNVDGAFGIFSDRRTAAKCLVIGRSATEALDVGAVMRSLGGGGHPGAGSAMLSGANPEAVEEMIRSLIAGNQQASIQVSDHHVLPGGQRCGQSRLRWPRPPAILREKGCTGMPVVDDGRLVGVLSRRDFPQAEKGVSAEGPGQGLHEHQGRQHRVPARAPWTPPALMVKHDIGRSAGGRPTAASSASSPGPTPWCTSTICCRIEAQGRTG